MTRHGLFRFGLLSAAVVLLLTFSPYAHGVRAQRSGTSSVVTRASDWRLADYWDVRTNGNDTSYGQGLTHRYVDGELRFLTIAFRSQLHEFALNGTASHGMVTTPTETWDLAPTGALNDFNGIWFEQARNRLWITSAEDYTAANPSAKITVMTLEAGGRVSHVKTLYVSNVPAKRMYGGCQALPSTLAVRLGQPYVCGWGGYASLLNNAGGASIGATMYLVPDPDTLSNGASVKAQTILDHQGSRGVRLTIPENGFDDWRSPNRDGLGWMVWGDSYYNTGVWIGTTFGAVASLCQGKCWYEQSTLHFTGRQFELHLWDGESLGKNRTQRPTSLAELTLPRGNDWVSDGNTPATNIAGATYDPIRQRLFMIGFTFGATGSTGRLYAFAPAVPLS